ncbi:MAG TPA: hypothetical protein VE011_09465 [Candidatus Dormibacteraeota bacterium]|nr:hypothetical protein [Candidatus Dormibacteraeota bacterium]
MSSLPHAVAPELEQAFVAALDPTAKLVAALDALGPIADRDVIVVDAIGGPFVAGLGTRGARLREVPTSRPLRIAAADASADVVLGLWSAFRGVHRAEVAEVDRVLRPGGRHLVVHDYGRDDVSRLHGDRPEYGAWSQRTGPFLTGGFRVRVVHCFWEFESQEATTQFLGAAFGAPGARLALELKRPRLSWNVAVYHRTRP